MFEIVSETIPFANEKNKTSIPFRVATENLRPELPDLSTLCEKNRATSDSVEFYLELMMESWKEASLR